MIIKHVEKSDFCNETVEITTDKETFYVQTTDNEYRYSLGCEIWNKSDTDVSEDDQEELIEVAEKFMEEHGEQGIENPAYINKDSSPYTRRYLRA